MEVIIGIIFGMVVATGVGYWSVKKTNNTPTDELEPAPAEDWKTLSYPLQQQLRHAIFECEQELRKCSNELQLCYQNQLELVQEVGSVSYVEVKDKPLFFEYSNSVTNERCFYYERDLKKEVTDDLKTATKKLLGQYQNRIDLLETQQQLFEKLIVSHQENLECIEQPEKINPTIEKLNKHKDYLKQQTNTTNEVEKQAIYNQLLLEQIAEEVQYQVDCVEQYNKLKDTYESTSNNSGFKIELEQMMKQVEAKDPKI